MEIVRYGDSEHADAVLRRLNDAGFTLSLEKCNFAVKTVDYLWFIDKDALHKSDSKIKCVNEAPRPTHVTSLRLFLGLVNN